MTVTYELQRETGVLAVPTTEQVAVINGTDIATGHTQADVPDDQINGALALDRTVQMLATYSRLPKPEDYVALALLIAGTHFTDKEGTLLFDAYARGLVLAPLESGKTRILREIVAMSRNAEGPLDGGDVTPPFIRNLLDAKNTVVLDEAHLALGTGRGNNSLKSTLLHYLNAGGAGTGKSGVTKYNTFGPVFMGAQPQLMTETKDRLLDLFSRCFTFFPEYTEEFIPDLDNMFRARAEFVNYSLGRWAAEHRPVKPGVLLEPTWTDEKGFTIPKRIRSRKRELAAGPLAVADLAEDLRYPVGTTQRYRWSIIARNAMMELLLHEGDPKAVLAKGEELFKDMNSAPLRVMEEKLFTP